MSILAKRLDVHFAALAAVGAVSAVGATAQKAEGAIVYSGIVNIPAPATTNGLYLNIVTGALNEPGNTSGSSVPGWDINPYGSTQTWYGFGNAGWGYVGTAGTLGQLNAGDLIDATTAILTGSASASAFPTSSPGAYAGFKFTNEGAGNQIQYAWARYYHTAGGAGVIVDYAYDDSGAGINAGAVPAPTAGMAVLALGGMGLLGRRRK